MPRASSSTAASRSLGYALLGREAGLQEPRGPGTPGAEGEAADVCAPHALAKGRRNPGGGRCVRTHPFAEVRGDPGGGGRCVRDPRSSEETRRGQSGGAVFGGISASAGVPEGKDLHELPILDDSIVDVIADATKQ